MNTHANLRMAIVIATCCAAAVSGCATPSLNENHELVAGSDIPRELQKISHPTYRVAPPDILIIEAVHNIRPAADKLRVGDVLTIQLGNPEPLSGGNAAGATPLEQQARLQLEVQTKFVDREFRIQPDGTVDFGAIYGKVKVEGLTLEEAKKAVRVHFTQYGVDDKGKRYGIKDPQVSVTLPNVAGKQVIAGEHLVRPDGTIALGVYGSVHVAGQSLAEVKASVESYLSQFINKPEVSVDVAAYNSKVYYVITDGGGYGETIVRLPCTGNETVLDALSNVQGLSQVSGKKIWLARPSQPGAKQAQILDLDYNAIVREGITTTNYQILPGDRVYIAADPMISLDNFVAKLISPFERLFGFTLLGNGTVRALQQGRNSGGGGGGGAGAGAGFF